MSLGRLTIEHIIQSNLIEGVTDRDELPKSVKAWEYLLLVDVLDKQNVLDIHRLVMTDLMHPSDVGAYRRCGVSVGGRICPHFLQVPELMDKWISSMRFLDDLDTKIKHIQFEHIHPFCDGNGRIGRLLMWWHEYQLGRIPTLITYEERWDYYSWFEDN